MATDTIDHWEQQLREAILGTSLSSVEFVQDYVQLRFDGPMLTVITWPIIEQQGHEISWGEEAFRNKLCSLIGERVVRAEILRGDSLRLEFGEGSLFKVSLNNQDYRSAEAVRFEAGPEIWWVL